MMKYKLLLLSVNSSRGGGQQMITVAQAGQLLAPMVAQQVAKETRRLEIRFQVRWLRFELCDHIRLLLCCFIVRRLLLLVFVQNGWASRPH